MPRAWAKPSPCSRPLTRGWPKTFNVVAGYVETHGRAETEAKLAGLEIIPRRQMPYHGTSLPEMDLDAVLARRPQLVLVDELAHTNAPGFPA